MFFWTAAMIIKFGYQWHINILVPWTSCTRTATSAHPRAHIYIMIPQKQTASSTEASLFQEKEESIFKGLFLYILI